MGMSAITAVPGPSPAYRVQDDLNRESLPQSQRDPGRKIAWMNAICATVLAVGVLLRRDAQQFFFNPAMLEIPPVVIPEFVPEPPQAQQEKVQEEQPTETPPDAPVLPTLVAPDNAKVNFEVQVTGPTVTKTDVSKLGPPPRETRRAAPVQSGPVIFRGGSSTDGGFYPLPSYPRDALLRKESGDVQAYVEVAEDGTPSKVEIRVSSGSSTLDRTLLSQIRKLWRWPVSPGGTVRQYLVPFEFRLSN